MATKPKNDPYGTVEERTRFCPICNTSLVYNHKGDRNKAERKQQSCTSCSAKKALTNERHRVMIDNSMTIESRKKRGDVQRYRGANKTYTKRLERHEHRIVMEEIIGRPLRSDEIVHHIDGNKKNNDPSNLYLTNRKEHINIHFRGKKINA